MADYKKRIHQSYFRIDDLEDKSVPLLVNSCGEAYYLAKDYVNARTRNDYYLVYMVNGSISVEWKDKKDVIKRGSAVLVSANTFFSQITYSKQNEYVNYLWVHFTGNEAEKLLCECKIPINTIFKIEIKDSIVELFEELFAVFRNAISERDHTAPIILRYLFFKLGQTKLERKKESRKLDASLQYIHTHISEPLPLEKLAAMEFLSTSRYRDLFRKATGYSPSEYITRIRIRQACELINEGNLSIEEISLRVGYTDRLYFQRVFKSRLGITPGEYKKRI